MLSLQALFGPLRIGRLVDAGRVFCPVRGQDIDVDRCGDCAYLDGVVQDGDDALSEISCRIPLGALPRGED